MQLRVEAKVGNGRDAAEAGANQHKSIMKTPGTMLLAACMAGLLPGCASAPHYAEPALPADQIAFLQATVPVWIISIDGVRVDYGLAGDSRTLKTSTGPHVAEVTYNGLDSSASGNPNSTTYLPGERSPYTRPVRVHSNSNVPIRWTAVAGHTYSVTAQRSGKFWRPVMSDFEPAGP